MEGTATAPPPEAFNDCDGISLTRKKSHQQLVTQTPVPGQSALGVQEAYVRSLVRHTPDWPKQGVIFHDLSPLLADARALRHCIDCLVPRYSSMRLTHVAGVDARGFTIACALAYALNCGFIMIRKAGKLPPGKPDESYSLLSEEYNMEYGQGQLQMAEDLFDTSTVSTPRVLLVDDLLASGGTTISACNLLRLAGATVVEVAVLIEIVSESFNGRRQLKERAYIDLHSLLSF